MKFRICDLIHGNEDGMMSSAIEQGPKQIVMLVIGNSRAPSYWPVAQRRVSTKALSKTPAPKNDSISADCVVDNALGDAFGFMLVIGGPAWCTAQCSGLKRRSQNGQDDFFQMIFFKLNRAAR